MDLAIRALFSAALARLRAAWLTVAFEISSYLTLLSANALRICTFLLTAALAAEM